VNDISYSLGRILKTTLKFTAPGFDSSQYIVDEGAATVQVCMHLGGEDLVDNVTLFTLDGSARGKFNFDTFVMIA